MAVSVLDGMTIDRNSVFRGAARAVYAASTKTFPTKIEDVIDPSSYELASGWSDLGATNDDGFTLRRSVEVFDGITIDQLKTKLDEGEPESWMMESECTLMDTSLDKMAIVWQGGTIETITAGAGTVAQHALPLDAPASFTSRRFAYIQQDEKTGRIRVFVFRDVIPQVDGSDLKMSGKEGSPLPAKFKIKRDTSIALNSGQFGKVFQEDVS
ncbi:MAG: hypothetical protein JXA21_12330 [Anaerolineae bacterium]|nr:hypothetical protein [Anaerolineae bacterium]